jgi:hypothetical protein
LRVNQSRNFLVEFFVIFQRFNKTFVVADNQFGKQLNCLLDAFNSPFNFSKTVFSIHTFNPLLKFKSAFRIPKSAMESPIAARAAAVEIAATAETTKASAVARRRRAAPAARRTAAVNNRTSDNPRQRASAETAAAPAIAPPETAASASAPAATENDYHNYEKNY